MSQVIFPFRREKSSIFGEIFRPVAKVFFWSKKRQKWEEIWMIIDTGADYTILPHYLSFELGIDLEKDCEEIQTTGVGGHEKVYLFRKQKVKLGNFQKVIPIGFLEKDSIPPLMGRQNFLEDFRIRFDQHRAIFST